jgi:D-amino-acid dehydrogenase
MTGTNGPAPHVVVVGAGVIGISCAYFLARRGAAVTVLERSEIGAGASSGNAGTIAPGHGPINKPGRVKQAIKSLTHSRSPLYVAPRWDPRLAAWLLAFARRCTAAHHEYCLHALAPLSHATPGLFDTLVRDERLTCGYRAAGYYEVFLTEAAFQSARNEADVQGRYGFQPEVLDGTALRARVPALKESVRGGVFFPQAATLNPRRFLLELADRARQRGAVVRTGTEVVALVFERSRVTGVRSEAGEIILADAVVLTTGAYSVRLVTRLGYRMPLQAAKGYHCDRDRSSGRAPALDAACMLGETSVFCTPMDGFVRFAGTLEFSGVNHRIRRSRVDQLARAAERYLEGMGEAPARSEWCGLRPCLPDGLPVIGAAPRHPGLYVATGHAMLGLTLGPITGQLMAECVLDGQPTLDLTPFRVERF